ncbi:MAG: OmpA family protein [Betaproteobacteria bacterium]|nr:OmpA family protein [Betaproteobacteria bacterium]
MVRHLVAALVALSLCASARAAAPEKYEDPDDARVHAAARSALPGAKIVAILLKVSGIDGLIQDLGARVSGQEIAIDLSGDVLFDFDKWLIRREAEATLTQVAALIAEYPRSRVRIDGHTDGKGDGAYNQKLSERRAGAIKDWLVARGAKAANLAAKGWGRSKPVAANAKPDGSDNPEGRQANRRVEIRIGK